MHGTLQMLLNSNYLLNYLVALLKMLTCYSYYKC